MGNQMSCVSSLSTAIASNAIRNSGIKPLITIVNVVNGRACQVEESLMVGELMLEFPGQCVVEFAAHIRIDIGSHIMEQGSIRNGQKSRRIAALPADHNLCAHHLYFLLPLQRIETRLSADELHILVDVATRLDRNRASAHMSTSKIMPLSPLQCEEAASITVEHTLQGLSCAGELLRGSEGKVQQEEEEIDNGDEAGLGVHIRRRTSRTMSRTRSWAPKLDTIAESLPLV